ncbi:hypothetical protein tloyanaT_13200 [Thalassotalea loyana]|uniref:Phage protein n=1 Tax=Thalassotalea loyana TaxID=280483 RepID=A0ABQ6HAC3_9GAMM|nr:hypothetical protein [Thalassotalea loyana]GLX85068.1 hypothetical protein tloyanaT_13200 [Thalassotalea loyana]
MKELENLKKLLQQNNIENLPNAAFISEAVEAMEALIAENKALRKTTFGAGSECDGEEDLTAEGVSFPDFEQGFNAAINIINKRMRSI